MKKCRFHNSALDHFNKMPVERLEKEINTSLALLERKTPRNHKEELLIAGNHKRVAVLKVILLYQNQAVLRSKVEEIAVLVD